MSETQKIFLWSITCLFFLFRTSSGNWTLQNPPLTSSYLEGIIRDKNGTLWLVSDHGEILNSTNNGNSWQKYSGPSNNRLYSICFNDKGKGWAVGGVFGRPYSLSSDDGGKSWNVVEIASNFNHFTKVYYRPNGDLWVLGESDVANVVVLNNDASEWKSLQFANNAKIRDVAFVTDSTIVAVGANSYIGHTVNNGNNWQTYPMEEGKLFTKVLMLNPDTGFILGYFGEIYRTVDGGSTWNISLQKDGAVFNCMSFNSSRSGVVFSGDFSSYGANVEIFVTFDGGEIWHSNMIHTSGPINDFIFISDTTGIACGENGAIYKVNIIKKDSVICEEITTNTGLSLECIDGFNDSCLISGTNKDSTVLISTTAGNNWLTMHVPCQKVAGTLYFDTHHIALIGKSRELNGTIDGGIHWSSSTLDGFLSSCSKEGQCALITTTTGNTIFTNNAGVDWVETKRPFSDDNVKGTFFFNKENIWAYTNKGKIAFSSNGTLQWTLIHAEDVIQGSGGINDILFISETTGFLVGVGANRDPQIFKTTDAGRSWTKKNAFSFKNNDRQPVGSTPSRGINKVAYGDPSAIWALTQQGILLSTDTGQTWTEEIYPQYGSMLTDIYCSQSGNVWIAGLNWNIIHYQQSPIKIRYPRSLYPTINNHIDNKLTPHSLGFNLLGRTVDKSISTQLLLSNIACIKRKFMYLKK